MPEAAIRIQVIVTSRDIRAGRSRGCDLCPVELALVRALGSQPVPHVTGRTDGAYIEVGNKAIRAPEVVQRFVGAYDRLGELTGSLLPVLPELRTFSFDLPPLEQWQEAVSLETAAAGGAA